jgi:hypothetical protein
MGDSPFPALPFAVRRRLFERTGAGREIARVLADTVKNEKIAQGVVSLIRPGKEESLDALLLFQGKPHLAGRLQGEKREQLDLDAFFAPLREDHSLQLALDEIELPLLFLLAVFFQHQPAARLPGQMADPERVLADLSAKARDAVLSIESDDGKVALAFLRSGSPVSFFVPGAPPATGALDDAILIHCLGNVGAPPTLSIYESLQIRKDTQAGRPISDYLKAEMEAPPFMIIHRRAGKEVERRVFRDGQAQVGRDLSNDLVVDEGEFSREQFFIRWTGDRFLVEDKESANGTQVNGRRIDRQRIRFGDRVEVGASLFLFEAEPDERPEATDLTTIMLAPNSGKMRALLIHEGQTIAIKKAVFTMGKDASAALPLKGFLMKKVQATLVREGDDRFRLMAVPGGRKVKVSGELVGPEGTPLKSGDSIEVGPNRLAFLLVEKEDKDKKDGGVA